MLNLASSPQEMHQTPADRKTLETLVAKYPGSEAAEKAKRRLIGKK
jgi:TolA-binding protein